MSFWILALLIGGLTAGLVAIGMGRKSNRSTLSAGSDVQVYRDQLKEVERDLARGIVSEEEAARVRIEVSRRLLEADKSALDTLDPSKSNGGLIGGIIVGIAVLAGSVALYTQIGQPNYRDLPLSARIAAAETARATRPDQQEIEDRIGAVQIDPNADPRLIALMVQLRAALKNRPDDLQGYVLLARNEAVLGDFPAAHAAQARVIEIKGDEATAADFADYADLLVLSAGGYVSPTAETALTLAMQTDPRNGTARYYSGLMFAQNDRPDLALRIWKPLLDESTPQAPWYEPVRRQIEIVAADAGVRYELPSDVTRPRGPSQSDIAAASDMSDEDRQDMIQGMVNQLSERLASEGGPATDWARLIGALGVLGDAERATAIWQEARVVFAADPDAMTLLADAADRAGIAN